MDLPVPAELKARWHQLATRRHFLGAGGKVLAWAGLASLLEREAAGAPALMHDRGVLAAPHLPPTAKRVIYLFMSGGPPQMDMFDYKPDLAKWFDKDLPESVRGTAMPTGMTAGQTRFPVAPSQWGFKQYGQCGRWVTNLLPQTAKLSDDMALIRSMHTDAINHEPAILLMNTGNMTPGKPSMGSWLAYGLGSTNDNLPTFVVLNSNFTVGNPQPINARLWSSGFLSSRFAGVMLRSGADPVLYLKDPAGMGRDTRRTMLDAVNALNEQIYQQTADPETQARISQYEMAFRMQTSVPELADFSDEPQSTWDLYGPEAKKPGSYAYNCLMARRLAERGVRFTQVYKRGWDVHGDCVGTLPNLCRETDAPTYALLTDLKQRGMLDDTLVVWSGEFGRTVYSQGGLSRQNYGRDHHAKCFSVWLAGGGVKGGVTHGQTDDFSYSIAQDPVHVRDLAATILHTLGINHEKLTYRFQGLDQRLTGIIPANVVREVLA
ncbi:MAG: DUF1501 domain-containing protein [Planctomycetes bacterium]|nr:DUF1501 domain-containing protein [Planctomycetota bacterium]